MELCLHSLYACMSCCLMQHRENFTLPTSHCVGKDSWYSDSLRTGGSGNRIPVWGEFFCICPHRSWGPPSLLYQGYRVFPGSKAAGAWRWRPIPSSAEVKERVELHLYAPSGPLWPVLGQTFTFTPCSSKCYLWTDVLHCISEFPDLFWRRQETTNSDV